MAVTPRFIVYASSLGNSFFEEIRDLLACGLRELGLEAASADESNGFAAEADWHVVVAPHEFFLMGAGASLRRGPLPRNLVFYGAEQPGCRFYSLALGLFPKARAVWHLDRRAAGLLADQGLACVHVPPGYSSASPLFKPVLKLPKPDPAVFVDPSLRRRPASWGLRNRPLDVFFAGSLTDRRRRFFSLHADAFSRLRASLHLADERGLINAGSAGTLRGRLLTGLEQRSKVSLNIHRSQELFFEWHRIALHGLGQRCLVVTEPVSQEPLLRPGRDFVEAPLADIPALLRRLVSGKGLRQAQETADQGFETFSTRCCMADILAPAVEALTAPSRCPKAGPRPAPDEPKPGVRPKAELLVKPGPHGLSPKVTVAVSVFNYRRYLPECLDSVAGQTLGPLDLVVVDDASTDGSVSAASAWLKRHGSRFRKWTLAVQPANAGLSEGRNLAFSLSRTPHVFVLDADNAILPSCLERLLNALEAGRADFAYSYLARFGEEDGLANVKPWDPGLLKKRAYLDAMALIRCSAWKRAGGYDPGLTSGWEDYDFWLRLARVRGQGILVPEVLARYRVHLRSMLHSRSGPAGQALARRFQQRHGVKLDEGLVPQEETAMRLFGGGLPIRVEPPGNRKDRPRQGRHLVAALSILRDLNADLLGPVRRS
ncbi:MAG: glycosyltransferase family A protein [Elusimicrobiota bacterium]|jgi:hypothetical protein